ncbi:MAG: hypothetical protein K8T90_19790 [Planctomycetes bacterium]|nr:hypothetical protein [Planctomycetota bacterium]
MSTPHRVGRFVKSSAGAVAAVVAVAALALGPGTTSVALAQSCGGCAGPAVGGAGPVRSWLKKGEFTFRLSQENEEKGRSYRGRRGVENDFSETLRIYRTAATFRYGVTDDWSAELELTHPRFDYSLTPPGGARRSRTFQSQGDTSLTIGRMFDLDGATAAESSHLPQDVIDAFTPRAMKANPRPESATLAIWGGLSLPTGHPEKPDPRIVTRDVSVSNLQTGTGTFDPILRTRLEIPRGDIRWFAEIGARFPVYENRYDYQTGHAEGLVVGASTPLAPTLRASLSMTYQRTARDQYKGDDAAVGGGRWIYGTPALAWDVTESATIDLSVRITAWRDVETKLSDSGHAIQAGLTLRF